MGEKSNAYMILVGKPEGKRPLQRCGGGDIVMDLTEIRWRGTDWIDLAQERDQRRAVVNTEMKIKVP
jgi:hypothetical protein